MSHPHHEALFQPLALGAIQAPNRILMAPSPVAAPGAMACPRRSWPPIIASAPALA
jgi:hypothetical protein